jgi:Kef-type K+ transport system membrane component KefB
MLLGVVIGPLGLNFLRDEIITNLKFLENIALAYIAITAGGELKYQRLKKYFRAIFSILAGQIIIVFLGMLLLIMLLAHYIPFLSALGDRIVFGMAILFAGTALSTSPAVTIGIITELRSKGKVTDIVLALTVIKSILLVLMFPILITWAKFYFIEGTTFNFTVIKSLTIQFSGSLLIGSLLGLLIIWYLKYIKAESSIFLLGVALVIAEMGKVLDIEILLTAMVTGILVENLSSRGEQLIKGIEKSSLPLYIMFFCFAGASLHLETLYKAFSLTLLLVILRFALLYAGNYMGAWIVSEEPAIRKMSWMGFIGQAGIAVGLASIVERTFPGAIGNQFKTILIASVVINEFMGPIFFKYLLIKSGEGRAG